MSNLLLLVPVVVAPVTLKMKSAILLWIPITRCPLAKNPPNKNSASPCSAQYGAGYDQTNTVESNDDYDSLLNIF